MGFGSLRWRGWECTSLTSSNAVIGVEAHPSLLKNRFLARVELLILPQPWLPLQEHHFPKFFNARNQ
jgi:hypothetical protein